MTTANTNTELDNGAASLTIDLSGGKITVHHHDGTMLLQGEAPKGTWDGLRDYLRNTLVDSDGPMKRGHA